ncbi:alpha/beta hydrolase [Dysgonomonas sp. 520]|uniref:alpha/beta hydrolase n=1 Tax=Dysgonomonas sp. 520 TaxID=2302931 RepID=UPI0013D5BDC6|nr:alpha/beta hydrolase [Dysgonomonas sp. 520]NDW10010.1 alpha/beta hydrolase [Dysgonomonas sp. 520]
MNVYFVSGFLANCRVFDKIKLPEGFEKKYLEWYIPRGDESLEEYAREMAKEVDITRPFVLIGYSFGGLVVQEMNRFLRPKKTIIMASMKSKAEEPSMFGIGRKVKFADRFPMDVISKDSVLSKLYIKYVYHIPPSESELFIDNIDPVYMKWSIKQLLDWTPPAEIENLYHIQGTKDRTFPIKGITGAIEVENGDHLMVMKKAREINKILSEILRKN